MRGDFSVQGYEVEGLLSAGASGEVWLARSLATREQVALKRIAVGSETHEAARRLVAMLGELAHQHLVPVRELAAQDDAVVLVMTHADGGSLAQLLLARGTLDPGEVVTTVAPLAEALGAVHSRGFVHGDITPESIHYTAQGFPLLGDVGVMSLNELNELDASNAGTHGYTDPLAPGEGRLSPPGDVYSLAAVCYALLTGDPPPPPHERRPLHELAPGVPPGLAHAVEAGLQGDPARRPSAGQFAELLYGAGQPAPVRFPLGLVITGSDPFGQGGAPPTGQQGAPVGNQPSAQFAQAPTPPPPSAGAEQPPPVLGGGAAQSTWRPVEDDDEPEGRGRGVLIGALVGVSVLLVAGAITVIVWLTVSGEPDPNPTQTASQPTGDPTDDPTGDPTEEPSGPTVDDLETIPAAPPDDPEQRRWWDVLTELDRARSEAFARADPSLLDNVYTPDAKVLEGSLPEGNDRLQVEGFAEAGGSAEGVLFHIESVDIESANENETILTVVDQLQPHILVHPDGTREERPAGSLTSRRITLHRVGPDEWRIFDIARGNS